MHNIFNFANPSDYEFTRQRINKWKFPILIAVIILVIAIFVAIIPNILSSRKPYDIANITNLSDLPQNPPSITQEHLKRELYNIISSHFFTDNNASSINATIRSETIKNKNDKNIKSVEYIMDVDAYQQSYYVNMAWSDSVDIGEDISIECVPKDQSKYPDSVCYGRYYSTDSPLTFLPYESQLSSGESFETTYYGMKNDNIILTITIGGCEEDDNLKEEAISATTNYLEEVGNIDVNKLIFRRETDFTKCNQETE